MDEDTPRMGISATRGHSASPAWSDVYAEFGVRVSSELEPLRTQRICADSPIRRDPLTGAHVMLGRMGLATVYRRSAALPLRVLIETAIGFFKAVMRRERVSGRAVAL